jgi:LysM domain/Tachylectin
MDNLLLAYYSYTTVNDEIGAPRVDGYGNNGVERVISGEWNQYKSVFSGGPGLLFVLKPNGELAYYSYTIGRDEIGAPRVDGYGNNGVERVISGEWNQYKSVFSGGPGLLFVLKPNSQLAFYSYTTVNDEIGAPRIGAYGNNGAERVISSEWDQYRSVFSGGPGILFALEPQYAQLWVTKPTVEKGPDGSQVIKARGGVESSPVEPQEAQVTLRLRLDESGWFDDNLTDTSGWGRAITLEVQYQCPADSSSSQPREWHVFAEVLRAGAKLQSERTTVVLPPRPPEPVGPEKYTLWLKHNTPYRGVMAWYGKFPLPPATSAPPGSYLTGLTVPNQYENSLSLVFFSPVHAKYDVRVPQGWPMSPTQFKDVFGPTQPGLPVEMWALVEADGVGPDSVRVELEYVGIEYPGSWPLYVVQKGDTLYGIAKKFYGNGNSWRSIAERNGITDPKKLAVGQELVIPMTMPARH